MTKPVTTETRIMRDFGYFGYYLHMHWGGRNGKQHILVELLAHDGQMTQRDLQEASCITSASLSEVIAKLEAEGLVARERSETDRRQLTVTLTASGTARAHEIVRTRADFEARAFDVLEPAERERLLKTLDRIAERWEQIEDEERRRRAARDEKGDETEKGDGR
ncbi:MarR family winged helix-turn-helix transcriptional regulator [Thermophilibacter mediterraneus]|uniref:MarR family winged helix-turn-helix transcriptional regulator n=1 Tax=Thermophilibacter mediterraneus TaxID=1871031 RepID=UPI0032098DA1